MMSVAQAFALAWEHHQAGRLPQAEQLYRQILELDANQVDALHLLGIIAGQTGRASLAADYFQAVLRIQPDVAEAHNNLGLALQAQGKWAEAGLSHMQALRLRPDFAEAHANLARAMQMQGKLTEAVRSYEQSLRLRPDQAVTLYNLGLALQEQGKSAEAVVCLENAVRLQPGFAQAHYSLGSVLQLQGKVTEAVTRYRQALRHEPEHLDALAKLGCTLRELEQTEEAVRHLERAVCLQPDSAMSHINLAAALLDQGRLDEAARHAEQAVRLEPDLAEAHYRLGFLRLLQGNLEQGWPEHEWRLQLAEHYQVPRSVPLWDGSSLAGKTIVLFAEQGVGDTLQFIRYAVLVKERGARTVVACPAALLDLLAGCPGIDQLRALEGPLPPGDVHACLLSLPGLCGTTLATIPAPIPYLVANEARVGNWRERLAKVAGFKVGICWQGSPVNTNDRRRSVPLEQFGPLAEVQGVQLVSLQYGLGSEQLTALAGIWPVLDLPGRAADPAQAWVESAALVRTLDLVITVDTAVAHLAGALGVPVWVALPYSPDWRWMLKREDSPWYPTMRLFRQPQPGQWHEVFVRIAEEIRKLGIAGSTA